MADDLIEFIEPVRLPAIEEFNSLRKLRKGESVDNVVIARLGGAFMDDLRFKIEDPVLEVTLRKHRIARNAAVRDVIPALGGPEQAVITLGRFWTFLVSADRQYWYTTCVHGISAKHLYVVVGYWEPDGLVLDAVLVTAGSTFRWNAGGHLITR